jgi:protein involved in polysaccharide export with SLBB domain
MKLLHRFAGLGLAALCGALLAGCLFHGQPAEEPVFSDTGFQAAAATEATNAQADETGPGLHVGELINVTFSDLPTQIPPYEGRILEDGTITLIYNQTFTATNVTTSQLQEDIYKRYVPKYFPHLTVTVSVKDRFFYVQGEVHNQNRFPYLDKITVMGAITAAGGFTDFAKQTNVRVIRSNGRVEKVNCKKASHDPALDLPIYPGDRIVVPRRIFF